MMQFITIKPLSVNECWAGRRFKTPKYQQYEMDCFVRLKYLTLPPAPYELKIAVGVSNMASDSDNFLKPFIDILQKKYKFNDKHIMKITIEKFIVEKKREYIGFEITHYEPSKQ